MSIVKDLFLISIFLVVVIKYIVVTKELEKQRNYFINTLSHDLRVSSIAQIRALEVLKKNLITDSVNSVLIEEINKASKFSLDMITMLLSGFRYEKKEEILNYEKCDIINLFSEIAEDFSDIMSSKNIKLKAFSLPQHYIEIDKNGIKKVLSTFLSVAIENSEVNSKMAILIKKDQKNLHFTIIYKGKFLSEEEYKRMFMQKNRFSTVGFGIQMHLCKKIIDFHKGKIQAKTTSKNLNKFTFSLPLQKSEKNLKSFWNYNLALYKFANYNKCFVNNFNKN